MNYSKLYLSLWAQFSAREYDSEIIQEYDGLSQHAVHHGGLIGIAYTTDETETHEIQVYFNVYKPAYITEIDGDIKLIEDRSTWSPSEIVNEIENIDFNALIEKGLEIISEMEEK